ncbi:unnamed protein product [Oncorhynchus mykiss]|uniref:Uncharacterized protein n=1 Tax=Oncorhynchus mykiss TaxID=8022 RepID=A0A060Y067_ONCMY|nr:unnamed protein product [Oncorhynchus mykiss]
MYQHNPILKHTQSPLYAPLLPFPYGSLEHTYHSGKGYATVREEAVKLFNCLQQLECARDPVPLIQGVLQTCLDLRPLRDEVYCQLVKQTSCTPQPHTAAHLRYWQLLTCMSCTFLPGPAVLKYLRFHLKRIQSQFPESEMDNYASFIGEALEKTRCRECVPSWEEIQVLMGRQEMLCTVHYPGPGSCQLHISSHTTANEVVRRMLEKLGLKESRNTFSLFEQNAHWERAVGGSTIIADILTRFEKNLKSLRERESFLFYLFFSGFNIADRFYPPISYPPISYPPISYPPISYPPISYPYNYIILITIYFSTVLSGLVSPCLSLCSQGTHCTLNVTQMSCACVRIRLNKDWNRAQCCARVSTVYRAREGMGWWDIDLARQLGSSHACVCAYVCAYMLSSTGTFSQKLWLGVAATCVSLYRQGEAEALESFPYGQICSYGVSDSNTFKITAGDRDLLFETTKLTEIMQLMNAYFSAIHRQRGGATTCGHFQNTKT